MPELEDLEQIEIQALLHSEFGPASLEEVRPEIANTLNVLLPLFRELGSGQKLPRSWRSDISNLADQFLQNCARARNLNPATQRDFQTNRSNTIEEFRRIWDNVGPRWGFLLALQSDDLKNLAVQARDALEQVRRIMEEAKAAKDEAESAAKAAKDATALAAVSELAGAYKEESENFNRRARLWATICLLITAGGGWVVYVFVRESMIVADYTIARAIFRAVVIGAIFGLFHLCLRTYHAYRHLEVVNRHRVNIGRTYEAFKESQPTEHAKEVMAALTAECRQRAQAWHRSSTRILQRLTESWKLEGRSRRPAGAA